MNNLEREHELQKSGNNMQEAFTTESVKKTMTKIFAVTKTIQEKHPELYLLLNETPLFLSFSKNNNGLVEFLSYLESIEIQLKAFNMASIAAKKHLGKSFVKLKLLTLAHNKFAIKVQKKEFPKISFF